MNAAKMTEMCKKEKKKTLSDNGNRLLTKKGRQTTHESRILEIELPLKVKNG